MAHLAEKAQRVDVWEDGKGGEGRGREGEEREGRRGSWQLWGLTPLIPGGRKQAAEARDHCKFKARLTRIAVLVYIVRPCPKEAGGQRLERGRAILLLDLVPAFSWLSTVAHACNLSVSSS